MGDHVERSGLGRERVLGERSGLGRVRVLAERASTHRFNLGAVLQI